MMSLRGRSTARWALSGLLVFALFLAAACDDDDGDLIDDAEPPATLPRTPAGGTPDITGATPTPTPEPTETPELTGTPDVPGGPLVPTLSIADEGDLAPYLVGPDGMTLYVFTNDEPNVSNCTGDCAANWPPFVIEPGDQPVPEEGIDGALGVIEDTGQVTYDEQPLYYYVGDQVPGDTNGHEVGDVWFVVQP